jgi:hypothetical protein
MVPIYAKSLVGLASNQVEKPPAVEQNLKGYHGEEHTHEDQHLLA